MSAGLKYTLMVTNPDTYASVALLAGKPVPEWAEGLVHVDDFEDPSDAPAAAKGQPEAQDDEADAGEGKGPTKAELEAEIARRNEGRAEADLIKPDGKNKPDLVAALAADDQKSA